MKRTIIICILATLISAGCLLIIMLFGDIVLYQITDDCSIKIASILAVVQCFLVMLTPLIFAFSDDRKVA